MTVAELFEKGKKILYDNGTDNYANEARWIFEAVLLRHRTKQMSKYIP